MKNNLHKLPIWILTITVIASLGIIGCSNSEKDKIIVSKDGTGDFSSINEAINNWKSNQNIFVKNGYYFENITMKDGMEIIGEDNNETVINGNKKGWVIKAANYCKIENLKIVNSGNEVGTNDAGIMIEKVYGCKINNNVIANNGHYGIIIRESKCAINNNEIYENEILGIYIDISADVVISNNNLFSHK